MSTLSENILFVPTLALYISETYLQKVIPTSQQNFGYKTCQAFLFSLKQGLALYNLQEFQIEDGFRRNITAAVRNRMEEIYTVPTIIIGDKPKPTKNDNILEANVAYRDAIIYGEDLQTSYRQIKQEKVDNISRHVNGIIVHRRPLLEIPEEIRATEEIEAAQNDQYAEIMDDQTSGTKSIFKNQKNPLLIIKKKLKGILIRPKENLALSESSLVPAKTTIDIPRPLNLSQNVEYPSWVAVWSVFTGTLFRNYFGRDAKFSQLIDAIAFPKTFEQTKFHLKSLTDYGFDKRADTFAYSPQLNHLMKKLSWSLEYSTYIETSKPKSMLLMDSLDFPKIFPTEYDQIHKCIEMNKIKNSLTTPNGKERKQNFDRLKNVVFKHSNCTRFGLSPNDIYLANGSLQSLYEAVEFFLQPGKNVLIPAPCSEYIETLGFLKKVEPRYYKLLPNSDSTWRINFEDLEQRIDENTSVVLIQNPNGVCGAIHSLDELKKLKDIVERHQVPVISDEYFGDIIFGNSFHSFLEVEPNVPVVIVNSCFKRLFQKEYNIGWLALYDKDEKLNGVRSILEFTEANYFTKRILIDFDIASDLLNKHLPKALGSFCSFIQVNFGIASSIFQHCPGLKIVQQQGGWFMLILLDMTQFSSFTSDLDFCLCLFDEQSVKIPPGSLNEYPNSLKFSLLVDQHSFLQICNRLKDFCKKHANC